MVNLIEEQTKAMAWRSIMSTYDQVCGSLDNDLYGQLKNTIDNLQEFNNLYGVWHPKRLVRQVLTKACLLPVENPQE